MSTQPPKSPPPGEWREIASADDDMIDSDLIRWSGLSDVFFRWDLSNFKFTRDVAELCKHISIEQQGWDEDAPGRSGTWHIVETNDPAALKREMRHHLAQLLWDNRREILGIEQKRKKKAEEEERRRKSRRPRNRQHVCTVSIWDDMFPTDNAYYLERTAGKSPKYRLWKHERGSWEFTGLTAPAQGDVRLIALSLMKRAWGSWPPKDVSYPNDVSSSPGDILKEADIK